MALKNGRATSASNPVLQLNDVLPAGVMFDFGGTTAPSGFLLCDGSAVSRTTYASLFANIGTTHGVGDGSTTFNLPDMRGRVGVGKDNMGGTPANRVTSGGSGITGTTLGASGGTETHTLTNTQLPNHTHTVTDPGHVHNVAGTGGVSFNAGSNTAPYLPQAGTAANIVLSGTTGISIPATSGGASPTGGSAHNNTQPSLILNKIIKY